MPRLSSLIVLALACVIASLHPVTAALGDGWPSVSAARRAVARLSGGATVGALCAVSNCERPAPLPTPPGGKFAKFGPYNTRLVYLDASKTSRYGFPSAVVACPVFPDEASTEKANFDSFQNSGQNFVAASMAAAGAFMETYETFGRSAQSSDTKEKKAKKQLKLPSKVPGLAWSSGGQGSCLGDDGFANTADGWSETVAGDDKGYWLPDILHHAASWGIVTVCPALPPSIPVGDGGATVGAARMLGDLQPCHSSSDSNSVMVDRSKIAVAGYSLGGGRALRGAANDRSGVISAVIAVHPWGAPSGFFANKVNVPALFLSADQDTNAPYRDAERTYEMATGTKLIAALKNGNHYTSPRFWAGTTVSFILSTFPTPGLASQFAGKVVWGGGNQPGFIDDKRFVWTKGVKRD
tara:strand:+ start:2420 stop:3649 length:1230 start_codon:yes stop_codon:yes gene_type:complete